MRQKGADVAAALGVSVRTVGKWLARIRAGRGTLFSRASAPARVAGSENPILWRCKGLDYSADQCHQPSAARKMRRIPPVYGRKGLALGDRVWARIRRLASHPRGLRPRPPPGLEGGVFFLGNRDAHGLPKIAKREGHERRGYRTGTLHRSSGARSSANSPQQRAVVRHIRERPWWQGAGRVIPQFGGTTHWSAWKDPSVMHGLRTRFAETEAGLPFHETSAVHGPEFFGHFRSQFGR